MNLAWHRRQLTITGALIGNIVLLTLLIGGVCAWLLTHWGKADIHKEESKHLMLVASAIGSQVALAMAERHHEVRQVRDLFEHELGSATDQQKRQLMERVQSTRQHFSWLGEVAGNGDIRIGTGGLLEGASVAGRNWFEGARQTAVFFGNIHPAKLLAEHIRNSDGAPLYLLDIALPLRDKEGAVSGVLGSHFNWHMIEEIVGRALTALAPGSTLAVAIVNPDGAILFDTRGTTGNVGRLLEGLAPGQMIEARWQGDPAVSFMTAIPVPASQSFDGLGWRIAVREDAAVINSGIARMKWQVAAASLLAGLLFALLSAIAVRAVTRPMQALVGELQEFGDRGTLPTVKTHAIVEINTLHAAFVDMAGHVLAQRESLRETQSEIVAALGRAGEFRDNETGNHVLRMSLCCQHLAQLAGWSAEAAERLRLASQMHDIGKIGIPDHILLKPGRFEAEERAIMEAHSEIGARILSGIDTPLTTLARCIALTHHEKWDGSGYPRRLAGTDIPQEGRIAALCDVFDALLSSRPYKQGWPLEKVTAFVAEQSGSHFDPQLVTLFLAHLDDFVAIRQRFEDAPVTIPT